MDIGKRHVEMIIVPFNYYYSPAKVAVVREAGPCWLDPEVAEAAIAQGYAIPFDPTADEPKAAPKRRYRRKARITKDEPETVDEVDEDMS